MDVDPPSALCRLRFACAVNWCGCEIALETRLPLGALAGDNDAASTEGEEPADAANTGG